MSSISFTVISMAIVPVTMVLAHATEVIVNKFVPRMPAYFAIDSQPDSLTEDIAISMDNTRERIQKWHPTDSHAEDIAISMNTTRERIQKGNYE